MQHARRRLVGYFPPPQLAFSLSLSLPMYVRVASGIPHRRECATEYWAQGLLRSIAIRSSGYRQFVSRNNRLIKMYSIIRRRIGGFRTVSTTANRGMQTKYGAYINGQYVKPDNATYFKVGNPATMDHLCE